MSFFSYHDFLRKVWNDNNENCVNNVQYPSWKKFFLRHAKKKLNPKNALPKNFLKEKETNKQEYFSMFWIWDEKILKRSQFFFASLNLFNSSEKVAEKSWHDPYILDDLATKILKPNVWHCHATINFCIIRQFSTTEI